MPRSVIGRLGRWCFGHWWWVLAAWVVAVGAGITATGPLFSHLADSGPPSSVESVAVNSVLNSGGAATGGMLIAVVDGVDRADPAVAPAVVAAASDLAAIPDVAEVHQPFEPGLTPVQLARLLEPRGRAFVVTVTLADVARVKRDAVAVAATARLHELAGQLPPGARVEVGGNPALNLAARTLVRSDLSRAEYSSLPVTLIVLIIVFGGLVAAGLPVLTAAVSVAASMAVLLGFSTFTDVDQDGVTVVTLLGLGLSIDYGLLLIARYREELLAGWAPEVAVARAWATAGRTIMFSALTVAAALSGLLMFDVSTLTALGAAGVSIAVVAMIASLTFTAALVGLLRRWLRPSRRARRGQPVDDERGFFARLSALVQRRPLLVAIGTALVLLAAGAPLASAAVGLPGTSGLPRSVEAIRVNDTLDLRFHRPAAPAVTVVARTDPAALDVWAARWRADPDVAGVRVAQSVAGGTAASVGIDVVGDRQGAAARALVGRIRADRPAGGQSWVTGDAAVLTDLLGLIEGSLPWALGVTLLAMVVLLFAMTGSLVVPVKAVLANLVSLGATFGVLTAVFADGVGSDLLDTLTTGALNPFVVVLVFAFAFGLSMDYEVFLLGRIKEQVDHGVETQTAVRRGLQHTGRVITSAALLMVIVFSCFAAARVGNIEQIGLGLTVAVLIDATIVRCLLVPATMTLLGRWNWWAPAWMKRLHRRIGLGEHSLPDSPADVPTQPEMANASR